MKPQCLKKDSEILLKRQAAVSKLNEIVCKFLGLPKLRNANRKLLCIYFMRKKFARSIGEWIISSFTEYGNLKHVKLKVPRFFLLFLEETYWNTDYTHFEVIERIR